MTNYQEFYRSTFAILGHPLTPKDAIPDAEIAAAEEKSGVRLPTALREYYLVCGKEQRLNEAFNRLLNPQDWALDGSNLIFMEENQAVVLWAVSVNDPATEDPPVFQASNNDPLEWTAEQEHCSVFLVSMLHLQVTWGAGMRWYAEAIASASLVDSLDRAFRFVGEINQMRAYNRQNLAVCFLPQDDAWRVFAGAKRKADLTRAAKELGLKWETCEQAND